MIIKDIPEDFRVLEVLITKHTQTDSGQPYMLYTMDKRGYSTFDALSAIQDYLKLPEKVLCAVGLKDSDGVTTQTICLDRNTAGDSSFDIEGFNREYASKDRWIRLTFVGFSENRLIPGRLIGNAFCLVLRDMDPDTCDEWFQKRSMRLCYPNYYDKQRFGMPGHKKITHLIGKSLLDEDYKTAYEYVKESGAAEAKLPFSGDYKAFFDQISENVREFYDSSLYSYYFNDALADMIRAKGNYTNVTDEGISFDMPQTPNILMDIERERDKFTDVLNGKMPQNAVTPQFILERRLANFVEVSFLSSEDDTRHPGRKALTVEFFLPMGAFATMCIKQLQVLLGE